jgi:hypothetical protein
VWWICKKVKVLTIHVERFSIIVRDGDYVHSRFVEFSENNPGKFGDAGRLDMAL